MPSRSAGLVVAPLPADRALLGHFGERLDRVGRHERHLAVAGQQALHLLQPDIAAAYDHAAAAAQLQARDVEGGVEHPLHAAWSQNPCGAGRRILFRHRPGGHGLRVYGRAAPSA